MMKNRSGERADRIGYNNVRMDLLMRAADLFDKAAVAR